MQQRKKVEDFQDFIDIVNNCGKTFMNFNDFFEFPKGMSQAKYVSNKPKLEDVQVVKFVRGSEGMSWKSDHDTSKFELSRLLQKKVRKIIREGI